MTKIMISYRRDDSMDITGRIFDRLTSRYGRDSVFRDIDSIPPGLDFRDHLQTALDGSDVLMVVVGPRWMGQDRHGRPRIHSETDYVRAEVEIALSRQIPVIPLLVGGSGMPEPSELPESIRNFAYRNAVPVDSGRDFDHHMNGLIRATDRLLHGEAAQRPAPTDRPPATTATGPSATAAIPQAGTAGRGNLVLQVLGGAMFAQGVANVVWFSLNVITAIDVGALGQQLRNIWMYPDMIFGFGGLVVGIGTVYGKDWARFIGIVLCLLMSFGNALWFIDHFDKDVPRLIFAATGMSVLLGIVGTYLYVFRWPVPARG